MRALACLLVLAAAWSCAPAALAQAWPAKAVRIVVPFPAGGPSDVATRIVGQRMSETWGQPVLVENRPGGNTIAGAEAVAKATPDGYMMLMAIDSTLTMNQALYSRLPYDPLKDFAPVTLAFSTPLILVVDAATGPRSVKDLIQQAKSSQSGVAFGAGTITTQLAGELFKGMAGVDLVYVPYKGSAGAVQGLLSNDVRFIIDLAPSSAPHVKSGKFRALATLGSRPLTALPNVPQLAAEAGLSGFDVFLWLGLVAPAATPADIVNRVNQEMNRVLRLADVREKLSAVGLDPGGNSPGEFAAFIRSESERWTRIIRQANIKVE